MKNEEHNIQVACITYFRFQYPKHIIYAIPNGGARNIIVASKLKAEGVLSGIPDIHIPVQNRGYYGLYIEMKAGKNKPTENQITIMGKLTNEGYLCKVVYSFDEFKKLVDWYIE